MYEKHYGGLNTFVELLMESHNNTLPDNINRYKEFCAKHKIIYDEESYQAWVRYECIRKEGSDE